MPMVYASCFEYAICVIPAAEVGGLNFLFDIIPTDIVCTTNLIHFGIHTEHLMHVM